jgi:hypothetical protein
MDKQQVENVVTDTVAEAGDAVKGKLDELWPEVGDGVTG